MQRLALEQAKAHDIEYKPSAFWQLLLQDQFSQYNNYAVICEQAPGREDSRKRIDISVLQYDPNHHTFSPLLVFEAKRTGRGQSEIKPLEAQAKARAAETIDEQNLMSIYVMTVWGLRFRVWNMRSQTRTLEPMHGRWETAGTAADYLDVDSGDSRELAFAFHRIKNEVPLREPTIVRSQAVHSKAVPSTSKGKSRKTNAGPSSSSKGPPIAADTAGVEVHVDSSWDNVNQREYWWFYYNGMEVTSFPEEWMFTDTWASQNKSANVLQRDGMTYYTFQIWPGHMPENEGT